MSYAPLSTAAARDGDTLVITCTGSAETESFDMLAAALEKAHHDALDTSCRTVVADLRGLEFASSSCLKAFVSWFHQVADLSGDARYTVRIRSNPRHAWQPRSLRALTAFAKFVEIDSEAS
ncbi:MAG TPA: STAS domain-containing protein [Kofleriaceae bacterium]